MEKSSLKTYNQETINLLKQSSKHYDLNEEPIKFTIERSQTKHVFVTAINSLTKGSVELIKVDDAKQNTTLEGAVFKIVNKDGHDVRTDLTTDKTAFSCG